MKDNQLPFSENHILYPFGLPENRWRKAAKVGGSCTRATLIRGLLRVYADLLRAACQNPSATFTRLTAYES